MIVATVGAMSVQSMVWPSAISASWSVNAHRKWAKLFQLPPLSTTQRSGSDGSGTQPWRSTSAEVSEETMVLMIGPMRPMPSSTAAGRRNRRAWVFSRPFLGARSIRKSRMPITAKKSTTMRTAKPILPPVELEWARSLSQFTCAPLPSVFDRKSVAARRADDRTDHSDPPGRPSSRLDCAVIPCRYYFGQDASILSSVVLSSWLPRIHWVICFQKLPAPTEDGMTSEASNRAVACGSVKTWTDSLSIGSMNTDGSTPLLAVAQPDVCAAAFSFALAVAHSPLAR